MSTSLAELIAADAPLGWWRLNDALNATGAADASGNGRTGAVTGGVTFQRPPLVVGEGTSAQFAKASAGKILLGNPAAFQLAQGTLFVVFQTSDGAIGTHGLLAKQNGYGLFVDSGVLKTYSWGGAVGFRSSGINVADGKPHTAGLKFQSGVANGSVLYVDGEPVLTTILTVANQAVGLDLSFANASQHFEGLMQEAAVLGGLLSTDRHRAYALAQAGQLREEFPLGSRAGEIVLRGTDHDPL